MSTRVLVVDDILPNVKLLEAKLMGEYYEVVTALSGPEALQKVVDTKPDIVLLDVMMPGTDGITATRLIAQRHPGIAVLVVSMLDDDASVFAAVLREALSDEMDVETLLETDEALSFRRPGISLEVVRKLRRGHWSIQAEIDLHGLRRDAGLPEDVVGVVAAAGVVVERLFLRLQRQHGRHAPRHRPRRRHRRASLLHVTDAPRSNLSQNRCSKRTTCRVQVSTATRFRRGHNASPL